MKKLLLMTLLTFTFSVAIAANKLSKPKPTTTHLKLPAFNSVHVTGFVNVIIKGTSSRSPSDTIVESRNPQWVSAKVRHHVLSLRALHAAEQSRTAPTVKVRLFRLNKLKNCLIIYQWSSKRKEIRTCFQIDISWKNPRNYVTYPGKHKPNYKTPHTWGRPNIAKTWQ